MPFAEAEFKITMGFASVIKKRMGPTTALETFSALARAICFGTNSPITVETYESISVMTTTAVGCEKSEGTPMLVSQLPRGVERLVAAKADDAKPTSVMAT